MRKCHAYCLRFFRLMPGLELLFCGLIELKGDDIMRFLICNQQEGTDWVNRKVTRFPALGGCVASIGQPASVFVDEKADDAVMSAIRLIQIFAVGGNMHVLAQMLT